MTVVVFRRIAYAQTDPRARHGAWHAVHSPGIFACGAKEDRSRLYQQWEVKMEKGMVRPPGTACIKCLTATNFPLTAVELERARRDRRG
jgi:hypothetical protein